MSRGAARRDHPERHPQGVHGPQHVYLPARAEHADHLGHHRLHLGARCPSSTASRSRGYHMQEAGATQRRRSSPSPSPTACEYVKCGDGERARHRQVRRAAELLLRDRHELLHGDRQAARRARAVAPGDDAIWARRTSARKMLRTHCQTSGVSLHGAGPVQQRHAHHDRGDGGDAGRARSRSTPTRSTRRSRCRPTSPPASRATRNWCFRKRAASRTSPTPSVGPIMLSALTQELHDRALEL